MRPVLPAADDERGFTLIEVLITIALLSIAFVAILSAVAAMITAGAENTHVASQRKPRFATSPPSCSRLRPTSRVRRLRTAVRPRTTTRGSPTFVAPTGYIASVIGVQSWNGDSPATFGGDRRLLLDRGDQGLERLT